MDCCSRRSPFGRVHATDLFETTIDSSVENVEKFCVSGGKIGYQVEITLEDLRKVIPVQTAEITV